MLESDDFIGAQYGSRIAIPDAYGGGSIDWSKVDASDLESVRTELPPCQVRALLETRLLNVAALHAVRERQDMLIHALVGVSGDDMQDALAELANPLHLSTDETLTPSIMRYLNDIARASCGIGVRMDHEHAINTAIQEAIQAGGAVDYIQATNAGSGLKATRNKARDEDQAYIDEES